MNLSKPLVLILLLAVPIVWAGTAVDNGAEQEKILKEAGIAADGPSLLKYFQTRTPSPGDQARYAKLVQALGDKSYPVREKASRELIAIGEPALPFLKQALKDGDLEMTRRAAACIRTIERVPFATLTAAAAHLLTLRRPDGAAEVLLAYLPFADWEAVGDNLLDALQVVGLKGKAPKLVPLPCIVEAIKDKESRRRAAVAHVLGHAEPTHRKPLAGQLADPDLLVRYHAAASLFRAREKQAMPALIALLEDAPLPLAWRAEDWLVRVAGEKSPVLSGEPSELAQRKKWRKSWEDWWSGNKEQINLARLDLEETQLGLTMTCEMDGVGPVGGRVSEFDRGGNLRWTIEEGFNAPTDFQRLPGGRVLVAEHWGQRVTERNRQGKVVREWKLADKPVTCRRLPNGNTFMATYTEILEMSAAGKQVFSFKAQGMIYCACKLRNQHILYINSGGQIVELDDQKKQVKSFTIPAYQSGAAYWATIEPLPNGRYLVALAGADRVVEADATGKVHWECTVNKATGATRLPSNNILVASSDGRFAVEVNRAGKEVWRKSTKGRPFWARRY
jgi:hypothetical protein